MRKVKKTGHGRAEPDTRGPILVSACLLGARCRYDGGSRPSGSVRDFVRNHHVIPICPETLGGLKRPRPPSELHGCDGCDVLEGRGKVLGRDGDDLTENFIRGARKTLEVARRSGAQVAILKSRSPSCGTRSIYDGSFRGRTIEGMGVTARLLASNGIEVISEEDVSRIMEDHASKGTGRPSAGRNETSPRIAPGGRSDEL